jgi:predicted Co/Zn/Cd cation transporter (cation efflux family)
LKILYFPFLIAALLFTIVVFLAKCKKKHVMSNKKWEKISTQKNIVTIIALVAPIQFLATMTQAVLAIFYLTPVVLAFTAIILIAMLVFHIYYCVWYIKNFYQRIEPKINERIVHKGKDIEITSKEMAKKYPQPVD